MDQDELSSDYDRVISSYYGEDYVMAVVTIKVDTKEADRIAMELVSYEYIQDLYLVTGDTDLVAFARFKNYQELKEFVINTVGILPGVKETKTLMIVTSYKEKGEKKEEV